MLRIPKLITKTLSIRLSLIVVCVISILLMASLAIIFHYTRRSLREDSLQKAHQTLKGTNQLIDNVLLSVEQASGNIYLHLQSHLDEQGNMVKFSRRLVESNPYIVACALAFKPNYYKDGEYFMAYVRRTDSNELGSPSSPIIEKDSFTDVPYTEQEWYAISMQTGWTGWIDPLKDAETEGEPLLTFCLPIMDSHGERVGVMGVDVPLCLFSQIILSNKPSKNSYCTLLGSDGSYIVHPDSSKLFHHTVFSVMNEYTDPSAKKSAEAMMAGERGYQTFNQDGQNFYVFYEPFRQSTIYGRVMTPLNWSVGVIYPEDDIFGDYNRLLYFVLTIAAVGLLLLFVLCRTITHRRLMPLRLLTYSAQRIAEGNYNDTIPDSHQHDEIGRLQNDFQQMQHSLTTHVSELQQLTETLRERGEGLNRAYHKAQETNRLKTAFLHNMTNQMVAPAMVIKQNVDVLSGLNQATDPDQIDRLVKEIQEKGDAITDLLSDMLNASLEKEA